MVQSFTKCIKKLAFAAISFLVPVLLVLGVSNKASATVAAGTLASPTTIAATAVLTTTADGKAAYYSAAGGVLTGAFTIDHDTTVFVSDGDDGSHVLTLVGIAIAEDKTLTIIMNQASSTLSADANQLTVLQSVAVTGTGSLVFDFGACAATACAVVPVLNLGNATGDTIAVKDFTINGMDSGAGGAPAQTVGGTNGAITATGSIAINGGNGGIVTGGGVGTLTFTDLTAKHTAAVAWSAIGGTGGTTAGTSTGGDGGAVTFTDISGGIDAPTISFTGGTGGSSTADETGGAGGAMTVTDVTSVAFSNVTTMNFTGGAGGAGGDGVVDAVGGVGGALLISDGQQALTATTINISGGRPGVAGAGTSATNAAGAAGAGGAATFTTYAGLLTGATNIHAGDARPGGAAGSGAGSTGGAAANGGLVLITNFEAGVVGDVTMSSGDGSAAGAGTATGVGGVGGVGGALTITDFHKVTGAIVASSGAGGAGATAVKTGTSGAAGGAGGIVTLTELGQGATGTTNVTLSTGDGANAGDGIALAVGGVGGAGGALTQADITSAISGTFSITSGNGGNGGSTAGTAAGAVGGAGGLLTVAETSQAAALVVVAGSGGVGGATTNTQTGGAGGAGGGVALEASATPITGNVTVTGGTGGAGGSATVTTGTAGVGGIGGAIAIGAQTGNVGGAISLTGGAGGKGGSGTTGATGGAGGAGSTIAYTLIGDVAETIFIDDGAAGAAGDASTGTAGAGGAAGTVVATLTNSTVTGAVTVGDDGDGTITTATTAVVFSSNIGTSTKALGTLNTNIATTFHGNVYADSIASGGIAVTVTGTTEQVFSGAVTGTGDWTFEADAIANFSSTVVVDKIILAADAQTSVTFNDAVTITDDTGLTVGADANIVLGSGITDGETVITATHTSGLDIAAALTLKMPESFNSGTIIFCEDCGKVGNDPTAAAGRITVTDSTLATYTKVVNGQQIDITAVKKSAATIASALGVTEEAATALDNASTAVASDAALATILNATLSAGGDAATELTKQVQGSPAGISATSGAATASAGAAVVSVGSSRMASLRTGNAYASTFGSGFSAGNLSQSNSLWMKPFASFGDQGERKSIAGYDADTYGIAIGGDRRINAKSIVGLSFSFADTDVDGKGAGRSHSDISSYQLTAYGDYTTKNYYVEALVGYAYNDIDTTRDITATNTKAKGTTESDQFMINVSAGRPMKMAGAAYFTPSVGLNLTHVVNSAYTETGAGALNLRVDAEDITIAKAFLGGRYHANIKNSEGTFTPELRAKLLYDMAGDDGSSSSTFTGGGAAFNVKGLDVVEFATSVGFGLGYTPDFDQGVNLSLNYDAELKENFTGHSANFTLKYAF